MQALINNYSVHTTSEPPRTELVNSFRPLDPFSPTSLIVTPVGSWDSYFRLNHRIEKLLEAYAQLTDNWDEDGAPGISAEVVQQALSITRVLDKHAQPVFHAAPGPWGEVMLDLRSPDHNRSVELVFYPSRSVAVYFGAGEPPRQELFDIHSLPALLTWLNAR